MNDKRAIDIQSLFFYVFFSLPLFYMFDHPVISRTIRFSVLFGLLLLIFCIRNTRMVFWHNLRGLGRFAKLALGTLGGTMLLGTIFAQDGWRTVLFGINPEYLGLVSWAAFIGLGILFYNRLEAFLTSGTTLILSVLIVGLSLVGSYYEITHGLRISGLILQATTMGMYAVFTGVIGFWHLRLAASKQHTAWAAALVVLSTAVIVLTQSRIAMIACVVSYGVFAVHAVLAGKKRPRLALLAVMLCMVAVSLPYLSAGYFARFQTDSVTNGVTYRLELYRLTAKDVLDHNKFLGNGPSSLPESINSESAVPEDIQLSLQVGDVFLSSHNMFLDIGYCFGLLASLLVLAMTCYALSLVGARTFELWLLFVVVTLNALVNVTSLELTSWYFVLLAALVAPRQTVKKNV